MPNLTKKEKRIRDLVEPNRQYTIEQAAEILKTVASAKFKESIDVCVVLGVDPRKSDQMVRSSTVLPHGNGKKVRVAAFAQGENAKKALDAGADIVGFEDLAESIRRGEINFDVLIATPDAMRLVGQLGQILGPRGLMPNPKVGTVTMQIDNAIRDAKSGQVRYRTDKYGIIHCRIGQIDFEAGQLQENLLALVSDLKKHKPTSAKGQYLRKICLSSTMGPGLAIDISSLPV